MVTVHLGRLSGCWASLGGQAWRLHVGTLLSLAPHLSYLCVRLPQKRGQVHSQQGPDRLHLAPWANPALPSSDWVVLNKSLPLQEPQCLHLHDGQNLTFSGTTVTLSHGTTSESPLCLYKTVSMHGVGICAQFPNSHSA